MELTICSQDPINNPSSEVIINSLSSLDMATGEAFLIPAVNDMTYMQVSGDKNIGFDLEYQEGDINNHFRAKRGGNTCKRDRAGTHRLFSRKINLENAI